MTTKEELYRKAYQLWGYEAQLGMLYEELGELIVALNKVHRNSNGCSVEKVIDEIADVEIMMEQYCQIAMIDRNVIEKRKAEKLDRLRQRLEEAKNRCSDR